MPTTTNVKQNWTPVDTDSMGEKLVKSLTAYRELQKKANEARDALNSAFIAAADKAGKIPAGHTLLISHKFGQMSVALVKAEDAKAGRKAGSKPQFKL